MAWTLNGLLRDGHNHSVDPTTIRTEVESGPSLKKRITSDQTNRITGSVFLPNATAKQAFWTFWDGEANQGADWFDMPIVTQGVQATHEVRIDNPRMVPYGVGWRVYLDVETRERLTS